MNSIIYILKYYSIPYNFSINRYVIIKGLDVVLYDEERFPPESNTFSFYYFLLGDLKCLHKQKLRKKS